MCIIFNVLFYATNNNNRAYTAGCNKKVKKYNI